MSYVDLIVERFGGLRPMAAATGFPASTVQSWKKAGSIPDRRKPRVLAVATLLDHDIAAVIADFDRALPWWRGLSEARQRGLVNMGINLGLPRLLGFRRMLAALQRGDFATAAAEALDSPWATQVGARAQRIARLFREG